MITVLAVHFAVAAVAPFIFRKFRRSEGSLSRFLESFRVRLEVSGELCASRSRLHATEGKAVPARDRAMRSGQWFHAGLSF